MVTSDRIRLTGLLRKKPQEAETPNGAFSMDPIRRRLVRLAPWRTDCGLRGTARRVRPAWPREPCRLRAAPPGGVTVDPLGSCWKELVAAREGSSDYVRVS